MSDDDWFDPFTQDAADEERARRRAEREARRRARQGSIAEKVEAEQQAPGPAAPPSGDGRPPPPAAAPPPRAPSTHAPTPGTLWARRGIAAVALLALAALLVVAVAKLIGGLGGEDPPVAAPPPPKVQELLVPEGLDRRQVADLAEEAGLKGDYERASRSSKGFDPGKYGADSPPSLEGFLFPATYELPKKATVNDLVSRQLDAFETNLDEVDLSYAKSKNLTVYDVLKIASMIEREIQVPKERPLAAAVIYNRLRAGDTLGIDATIRYEDQNYDEPLTESRLAQDTPYNTRIRPGLPPTPIGNPGLASIEAAADPARSDAYYFVVKPGTCGRHVFVKTEEEFAAAEAAYQEALAAEGGSPTDC
jgi:UPF0755 protein